MTFTLASSTDTQEEVNAAAGIEPEKKETPKPSSADDKSKTGDESETSHPADEKEKSKSAAESGTAEVEEDEEEEEVEDDEEEEGEEKEEKKEEKKSEEKPKKGGFSKKIDRLTREKSDLARRLEAVERQLEEKNKTTPEKKETTDPEPEAKDFQEHAKFIAALARWNTRQENLRLRAEDQKHELQKSTQESFDTYNKASAEFLKEHDDWVEVVGNPEVKIREAVQVAIIEAGENGPALAYYLGTHPEVADEIFNMKDTQAVKRLGRIEATLFPDSESDDAEEEEKTPPKKVTPVSKASEPITPVKTSSTKSTKSPDEMTHSEYRAYRDRQQSGRFRN